MNFFYTIFVVAAIFLFVGIFSAQQAHAAIYTLTVNIVGHGYVGKMYYGSCSGSSGIGISCMNPLTPPLTYCSETCAVGTAISLHASNGSGYTFAGWSGCTSTGPPGGGPQIFCGAFLTKDTTVTATFIENPNSCANGNSGTSSCTTCYNNITDKWITGEVPCLAPNSCSAGGVCVAPTPNACASGNSGTSTCATCYNNVTASWIAGEVACLAPNVCDYGLGVCVVDNGCAAKTCNDATCNNGIIPNVQGVSNPPVYSLETCGDNLETKCDASNCGKTIITQTHYCASLLTNVNVCGSSANTPYQTLKSTAPDVNPVCKLVCSPTTKTCDPCTRTVGDWQEVSN